MTRVLRIVLVLAALGMLAYRFRNLDLAPFARDEPQFLHAAAQQLHTGHWLSANPLYGNLGLRYGPAAFWFYGVVQAVAGEDPRVAILAMGLTLTLAHLALALAVWRLLGGSAAVLAVLVAWVASSPYQFLWSRLAWDLTSNAAVFAAAALLCTYRDLGVPRALALGVVIGLGLSTHPMVVPFAIAVLAAVGWEQWRRGRDGILAAAALIGAMVLVSTPYLLFLLKARLVGRAPRLPLSPAGFGSLLLQAPRIATTWGLPYYFGGAWSDFRRWLGEGADLIEPISLVALVLCLGATVAGIAAALASSDARQRRMGRVALIAWIGNILLLAAVGLERHPHYNFSSAWVPVFGVASAVAWLRRSHPRAAAAALVVLALIAVGQFAVIVEWMAFIRASGGTRSPGYGTPIGIQIDAMRAACAAAEPTIVLKNETEMFPFPFEYHARALPECRSKTVVVCAEEPRPLTKPCPPPAAGDRVLRLRYADATGGRLTVE
jgi:MFS family permease